MGPKVGPPHDGLVGPFEVEGADQRLAHLGMLELGAACVDEPALRARRRVVRNLLALDPAALERRKIVTRVPDARSELLAERVALGREALEADIAVAVIFVAQRVEVVLAAAHRQVGAPPVGDALVFDETPGLEPADAISPAAERRVERRFIERTLGV